MNHVVLFPSTPVSAVPVLPPISRPGICAAVPVPAWTARIIIAPTSRAVAGVTARRILVGFVRVRVLPFGVTVFSTTYGRIRMPSLPIVPATIAICSGVTSSRSWPNAIRPASTSLSRFGS